MNSPTADLLSGMVKEPFESRPVGGGVCGGRGLLFKQKPSVVVFELLLLF